MRVNSAFRSWAVRLGFTFDDFGYLAKTLLAQFRSTSRNHQASGADSGIKAVVEA